VIRITRRSALRQSLSNNCRGGNRADNAENGKQWKTS
jgi:hypothetical protein